MMRFIRHRELIGVQNVTFYLRAFRNEDRLGTFHGLAEKILGVKIVECYKREEKMIYLANRPHIGISGEFMGPYEPEQFDHVCRFIEPRLKIPNFTADIVLIRRGLSKLLDKVDDTGAKRRTLVNQDELATNLQNEFGERFKEIVLEDIRIEEQIGWFRNATIIMGVHGAGLCNLVWVQNKKCCVIEMEPILSPTFKNMSSALALKYVAMESHTEDVLATCREHLSLADSQTIT